MDYNITISLDSLSSKQLDHIVSLSRSDDPVLVLQEMINTGLNKEICSLISFVERSFINGKSGAMSSSL